MKEKQYIKYLEDKLTDLITIMTDHSLFSFLTDNERKKIIDIIKSSNETKLEYSN